MSALGYARATNDIDYLVDGDYAAAVEQGFRQHGFTVFHRTNETLQLEGAGPIDILFANRPMSKDMLTRCGAIRILDVPVLDAADLIGLKIQAYRDNPRRFHGDFADIQRLIDANPQLDRKRVEDYARLFDEWERIRPLLDDNGGAR